MQISYKTIATFCEHTAEMLEGVPDSAELIKRPGEKALNGFLHDLSGPVPRTAP
jgi:hypothetical protein